MKKRIASDPSAARQRGLSVIALLFYGAVAAALLLLGLKLVPAIVEYLAIESAIHKIAKDGATVGEIRTAFDRYATIDDIHSISSKDLDITKDNDRIVVAYAYSYPIQVLSNVRLVIDFSGTTNDRPGKGSR